MDSELPGQWNSPRLYTPRLCLRPFVQRDGARVRELAGDARVAQMTASIPHPYPEGAAERFIEVQDYMARSGREFNFAITLAGTRTPGFENDPLETGHFIGAIGLRIDPDLSQSRGEIGYWIGVPWWGRGFATEAARAVLEFGFNRRGLARITGEHFAANAASGRVLQKLGMSHEGTLRSFVVRFGERHDVVVHGILAHEWEQAKRSRRVGKGEVALCV